MSAADMSGATMSPMGAEGPLIEFLHEFVMLSTIILEMYSKCKYVTSAIFYNMYF